MHLLIFGVIFSILIVVNSAPIENNEVIKYDKFNDALGGGRFSYELKDGTSQEQNIHLIKLGKENRVIALGKYKYSAKGPIVTSVEYMADHNGYRPRVSIYNRALIRQELPTNAIITLQGGFG